MDGMEQSPQIKEWHRAQAMQEREKEWMLSVMRYLKKENVDQDATENINSSPRVKASV